MPDQMPVYLFSYGTLQQPEVQLSSFGRLLHGEEDAMTGYQASMMEITDAAVIKASGKRFHPVIHPSDNPQDEITGQVFRITESELLAADAYEVSSYKRVQVTLRSGKNAWVYVRA